MKFIPLVSAGLFLGGCATATVDCADLQHGTCKVAFQRVLTDTSFTMTGPDGLGVTYSSSPNAAATQEAFAAINRLAGLVGTVAGRRPVEESEAEEMSWRGGDVNLPLNHISQHKNMNGARDLAVTSASRRYNEAPARLSVPESCPAGPAWAVRRVTGV